jgi:hypothetical protein
VSKQPGLDRWGRQKDLRGAFPDLTEDEALALRALHEGDMSYVKHLSDADFGTALHRVAEKGHITQDEFRDGEWVRTLSDRP